LQVTNHERKSVYQRCVEAMEESESLQDQTRYKPDDYVDSHDESDSEPMSNPYVDSTGITDVLRHISIILKTEIYRTVEDVHELHQLLQLGDKGEWKIQRMRAMGYTESNYEIATAFEMDLDFSELGDIKDEDALTRLVGSAGLQLDSLLRYVRLPANKTNEVHDLKARQKGLMNFFKQLKERHKLEGIMHLQVDESIDHPCPDEVIESALNGINIHMLDWRKTDMSSMVVINAAPNVRSLHLYSSGNHAVLMGWSAPEGLPSLPHVSRFRPTFTTPFSAIMGGIGRIFVDLQHIRLTKTPFRLARKSKPFGPWRPDRNDQHYSKVSRVLHEATNIKPPLHTRKVTDT
jgi:hypothetical protein